jgi:hypothetical protein
MAKVKDILIHVIVETAVRQRKCHRSKKHAVAAGSPCMVVKDGLYSKNYCRECAEGILILGQARLTSVRQQLGLSPILGEAKG